MKTEPGELSVRGRLLCVVAAFAVALLLTGLLVFPHPLVIGVIPLFPQGLFFLAPRKAMLLTMAGGWAVYFALGFFLLKAGSSRTFALLFLVLCVCLAVNVGGCKFVADNRRLPHTI